MSATRRAQLLMDPAEFRRLRAIARERKTSVAELIRSAVREAYLAPEPDLGPVVEAGRGERLVAHLKGRLRTDVMICMTSIHARCRNVVPNREHDGS